MRRTEAALAMGNRISSAVSVKRRDNGSVIDKLTEAQLDEFREAFNSFDKVRAGCGLLLSTSHWEERTHCPRAREGTRPASSMHPCSGRHLAASLTRRARLLRMAEDPSMPES